MLSRTRTASRNRAGAPSGVRAAPARAGCVRRGTRLPGRASRSTSGASGRRRSRLALAFSANSARIRSSSGSSLGLCMPSRARVRLHHHPTVGDALRVLGLRREVRLNNGSPAASSLLWWTATRRPARRSESACVDHAAAPRASPYCTNNPMDRASTACLSRCRARRSALFNNWRCESFSRWGAPLTDVRGSMDVRRRQYVVFWRFRRRLGHLHGVAAADASWPWREETRTQRVAFLARSFVPTGEKLEGAQRQDLRGGKYLQSGDGCSVRCRCDRRPEDPSRSRPVWKSNLRRVRPESPRRPPRHRRATCSMATSSPCTDTLVDFHTVADCFCLKVRETVSHQSHSPAWPLVNEVPRQLLRDDGRPLFSIGRFTELDGRASRSRQMPRRLVGVLVLFLELLLGPARQNSAVVEAFEPLATHSRVAHGSRAASRECLKAV